MNREKKDQLPFMQIGFIDSICAPVYEVNFGWNHRHRLLPMICAVCPTNTGTFVRAGFCDAFAGIEATPGWCERKQATLAKNNFVSNLRERRISSLEIEIRKKLEITLYVMHVALPNEIL